MEIKYNLQGYLVYMAMAAYLPALLATLMRRPRLGRAFFAAGFIATLAALAWRWYDVGHIPLQNMFEVFLALGVCVFPLSVFCRKFLQIDDQTADIFIGLIVLAPGGFVFSAEPQTLPPALQSWLFAPHVAVYMLSYVLMAKAAFQAIYRLSGRSAPAGSIDYESGTYRLISFGFPFLTGGLLLGSYWGKLAWGDFWGWDPKELFSLVTWLTYLIYFHWRYLFGKRHAIVNSILALAGLLAIIITLLWVNLSRIFVGLHSYAS